MTKIIFFDMDSTLIGGEGLDALAAHKNLSDKILPITQATMDGTMQFSDAFFRKVMTLAPSHADIARLNDRYMTHQDPAISGTFATLRQMSWEIGILSHTFCAGIANFIHTHNLADDLVYANDLERDNAGNFAGVDRTQHTMQGDGKRIVIAKEKKNGHGPIVMVGDSVGDMKTQGTADCFIGYGKHIVRPLVKEQAECFVRSLDEVIKLVKPMG